MTILSLVALLTMGALGKLWIEGKSLERAPLATDGKRFINGKWTSSDKKGSNTTEDSKPLPVLIHIAGSVRKPGLYTILDSTRVVDALKVAGGALPGADLDKVNLASFVYDGQRIYLPLKKSVILEEKARKKSKKISSAGRKHKTTEFQLKPGERLDLNSATESQLASVPEIGPRLAKKIVSYRTVVNKFTYEDELVVALGITEAKYERIRRFVFIKRP